MASRAKWSGWCLALGAAGMVFAARLREIRAHTGDLPTNDQWMIEGRDILGPWLDGTLHPGAFFAPHFEHQPVWTRLLAWLEVVVTGRWDPFIQTTVNALLFASFVALFVRWVAGQLRPAPALIAGALLVFVGSLAHDWENITWGFQSQFPLALLCLFLHATGSFRHPPGSGRWWAAQAAGLAGLFTLAGMWLAPLATGLVALWTQPRGQRLRLFPLAIAALGLGLMGWIRFRAAPGQVLHLNAASPEQFIFALLDQLGWPAAWPGAAALLQLPLLILALQLRGRTDAPAFDRAVLALGLWGAAQAAALSFARGAGYYGYVSRYGELLLVQVLANGLALARIVPALPRWRDAGVAFAAGWIVIIGNGAWYLSHSGHANYFHERSATWAQTRREAVQAYLQHGDRRLLDAPATRAIFYQPVEHITELLDRPGFRALLPSSVRPENPPAAASTAVRALQAQAGWLAALAALPLLLGVAALGREAAAADALPVLRLAREPLLPWLAAPVAVLAGAAVFHWPDPFTLDQDRRWHRFFNPPGGTGPLELHIQGATIEMSDAALVGAVPLSPPAVRFEFGGTYPATLEFRGTVWSKRFPVNSPWFVVPYTGAPIAHGNGLRLRIEEADGTFITEVACPGEKTGDVAFWAADVRPHVGKHARLVLYDGRLDDNWVGAAPPVPAADAAAAKAMEAAYVLEQSAHAHHALAVVALIATALLALWFATGRPAAP